MAMGSMTSTHHINMCKHGKVMGQCRCLSPNKTVRVVACDCPPVPGTEEYLVPGPEIDLKQKLIDWAHREGEVNALHATGYHLWQSARANVEGFKGDRVPQNNVEWAIMQDMCAAYIDALPDVAPKDVVTCISTVPTWYTGRIVKGVGDEGRLWEVEVTSYPEGNPHITTGDRLVVSRMSFAKRSI